MKNDFLKECMSDVGNMPMNDFNQYYCMRCNNHQCDRARVNNHIFVKRVTNWKENLFDNVQRADENDPKYAQIRSLRFMPKNPPLGDVTLNPDPMPSPVVEMPRNEPVVAAPEPVLVPPNDDEPEATSVDDEPSEPDPVPSPSQPQPAAVKNTPFQQGYIMEEKKDPGVLPVGGTFVFDDE